MDEFCKKTVLSLNQSLPAVKVIYVNVSSLMDFCTQLESLEVDSVTQYKYSQPMVVIGNYIAIASWICYGAMLLDCVHNASRRLVWFPTRYFSLNAASITVIAVAMKLPMDLSSPMPGEFDQVAKVGSLGFLCLMMSVLMPSLGSMDNRSLLSNVTGLSILVITVIVNVGIQIETQVISDSLITTTCIYLGMLIFLLLILISFAITIPTLKKVMEIKYQTTLNDQNPQEMIISNVEEVTKLLKRYWIMTETSSVQFVVVSTPLSSTSGIICAISMAMYVYLFQSVQSSQETAESVYKQSTIQILMFQMLGMVIGTVTLICRCIMVLRIKSLANQNRNRFSAFKVEKFWTQKLYEWKESRLLLFSLIKINLRLMNSILNICIGFQKVIVVSCKIIELLLIMITIFARHCLYYLKLLKSMLCTPPTASSNDDTVEDLSSFVLLPDDDDYDDVLPTTYPVSIVLASFNKFIRLGKRNQHRNLLRLVERSVSFGGVETFDTDQIRSLLPVELANSWSLTIISLTCIAIVIPDIDKDTVDNLLKSVREGIICTLLVEVNLNKGSEYVSIQEATLTLWLEVKDKKKWLETTLKRNAYEGKTPTDIIKSFAHIAEEILNKFNSSTNGVPVEKENLSWKEIAANSMYRIAQTIIHTYESNNLEITKDDLFTHISNMIGDILSACLTNIPRTIIMKCHESAIEKQETSVKDAVFIFGQTYEIIKRLETRVPSMDQDKMAFIDEWRLHLSQP